MVGKLKDLAQFVLKQNFVIRNLIIIFLGSLGGATYLGKVSEVATYYYAWNSGFRLPAEGVPYLALTVFALSFFVFISAFLVFIAIYTFGKVFLSYIKNDSVLSMVNSILKLNLKSRGLIEIIALGIAASTLLSIFVFIISYLDKGTEVNHWVLLPCTFILSFIAFSSLLDKGLLKVLATIIALICALGVPIAMFNQTNYVYILKALQYGGGISVDVTTSKAQYFGSKLLLRTSQSLILKGSEDNRIIEIPFSKVEAISYN
ncbi:hypothetical protein H5117_15595 [Pseudoalteromonas sp. SG45-1]|nr:hypothetical protein [Pseudoalteromonas sp. SG45-1]